VTLKSSGHVPREIWQIIWDFNGNASCEITRPRKRGVAMVVPCCYTIEKADLKVAQETGWHWFVQRTNAQNTN